MDISEWRWVGTGLFLCCYIILQKSRDLIKILTSACMLQSYKFPEFQKFYGRRYRSLPVCFKVPSYQSSRSFLVADTDLCLSVAKFPSYQSSRSLLVADTDICLSVSKFPCYQSSRSFLVADIDLCLSVAKFPSYQSSRSFLVADTDLCLSVAKLQVTRVPEVF